MAKKILIEGWRFIPHSYSCINMWQCLELLKRKGIEIYHQEMPYFHPWPQYKELISLDADKKLLSLPVLPENEVPDLIYRIDFPFRFNAGKSKRLFIFATSETKNVDNTMIAGGGELMDSFAESGAIIVTSSQWSAKGFINSGADPERVKVIHLAADTALFKPISPAEKLERRKKMGLADSFVFLNIGGMSENKGIKLLLKAFAKVIEDFPRAFLYLKGADNIFNSYLWLQKESEALTDKELQLITPRIKYYGESFSFSGIAELYQLADAYVSPYMAEGFNLPVLEAIASGLPVICTAKGPTDEFTKLSFARRIKSTIINSGMKTFLLPDLKHLIFLMKSVIEDKKLQESARLTGPLFVKESFTWAHYVDRLLDVMFLNHQDF
jgi:glycosyltransferase involved in cell wall biosynthesis